MNATAKSSSLRVPYGLAVHDEEEKQKVTKVLDEHRTNIGIETKEFEERIAALFGKEYGVMVNSGSSANLLAVELLNLPEGSEVITPLLTFSTTVAPLVKRRLTPVFVDVEEGTYVVNVEKIESLITNKTKALMVPLLLGNIPNITKLKALAKKYNLYLIEDSCDTLAAEYKGKPTGTYSDISTTSFFGSHIITAGGTGGMILIDKAKWRDRLKMLRGWGRTSSLFGESESIEKRFKSSVDGIPYDAKFIFDEIGYNFLPNEMGAAFGNAQLEKLEKFRETRERNFSYLLDFFKNYDNFFILPKQNPNARTQWLAFPLTISPKAPFKRLELVTYLEEQNIQTRPIFTGNILKQPGFKNITYRTGKDTFEATNAIMERGFVVGCHHGIENKHLEKLQEVFTQFLKKYS